MILYTNFLYTAGKRKTAATREPTVPHRMLVANVCEKPPLLIRANGNAATILVSEVTRILWIFSRTRLWIEDRFDSEI